MLETLDVAHTDIVTDSLLCLQRNQSLTCLGISHTEKVNGDTALGYLSGNGSLKNRWSVHNVGLKTHNILECQDFYFFFTQKTQWITLICLVIVSYPHNMWLLQVYCNLLFCLLV